MKTKIHVKEQANSFSATEKCKHEHVTYVVLLSDEFLEIKVMQRNHGEPKPG